MGAKIEITITQKSGSTGKLGDTEITFTPYKIGTLTADEDLTLRHFFLFMKQYTAGRDRTRAVLADGNAFTQEMMDEVIAKAVKDKEVGADDTPGAAIDITPALKKLED